MISSYEPLAVCLNKSMCSIIAVPTDAYFALVCAPCGLQRWLGTRWLAPRNTFAQG